MRLIYVNKKKCRCITSRVGFAYLIGNGKADVREDPCGAREIARDT